MQDIIQKLNMLKNVQPSEKWVIETRKEVLSKTPVFCGLEHNYNKKSMFGISLSGFFANKAAVSFASVVFVLFGGFFISYASKSSLPGDTLYPVKIASENVVLAIASEDKKVEVEIEQAGKRLEELAEISKKPSDINQGEKLKKLVANFKEKVNNAQNGLTKIEDNGKKVKIAKVINVQTEKYTEVLAVANENLTDVVKNDVSEKFDSAVDFNKKVNFNSLAVMADKATDDDKDEIASKINNEIDQTENEIKDLEKELILNINNDKDNNICVINIDDINSNDNNGGCSEIYGSDSKISLLNKAKEEIEKAKQNIKDNNLLDAVKNVALVQETIIELKDVMKKGVNDSNIADDENGDKTVGEVKGDSDKEELTTEVKEETTIKEELTTEVKEETTTKEEAVNDNEAMQIIEGM